MAEKFYQRRRRRKAYLDDFQINEDGSWEYTGERYVYQGNDLHSVKVRLVIYGIVMLAATITAGCFPATGVNTPLVLIPYALATAFSICTCWSVARFCKGGNPMRSYTYIESVLRIPRRALITAVSCGASLTGQILYVIQNKYWKGLLLAPVFPVSMAIAFLTAVSLNRKANSMKWTAEKK